VLVNSFLLNVNWGRVSHFHATPLKPDLVMLIVLLRIILNIEGSVNVSFDYVYPVKFIRYRYMVLRGAHPVRVNFSDIDIEHEKIVPLRLCEIWGYLNLSQGLEIGGSGFC
jgi:hypothetical protein